MPSNPESRCLFIAGPATAGQGCATTDSGDVRRVAADWRVDHELKLDPARMAEVLAGTKTHEVRRFDRDFKLGDTLLLREFDRQSNRFVGPAAFMEVTNVTLPGTYGLPAAIGVMSVAMRDAADLFTEACILDDEFPASPVQVAGQNNFRSCG